MKKMRYFMIAALSIAALSCSKENLPETNETNNVQLIPMSFTATADAGSDEDTKVFYDGETKTTQWKVGDKIAVISSGGTATEFIATSVSDNGISAIFEGLNEASETYYAVSPASAYKGTGSEIVTNSTLYVNIPNEQTAVAGTFDPAAFVSVAKNEGGNLSFKNSCSVIRFSLNNTEGVKSVRFTANDITNLAGTQNVLLSNIPTHSWGSAFDGRSAYNMITLNAPAEGFAPETDYYMTMRPQTMTNGINLYIEYNNTVKVRKGQTSFPASTNTIRDLKALDAGTLENITPYDSYQLGFNLNIGGNVYNKSTHSATLVNATEPSTSLYNQINAGGLYFIETSGEGSFNLPSNVAVTKDIILIGNSADTKVNVDFNGKNVNHAAGTIALKNIALDVDAHTNYVFANNNATADTETFILDNCSVNGLVKPLYYVNVAAYTIKNVVMADTDVQLGAPTNIIDLSKTTSLGNETINISNCIFYAATNTVSRIVNNSQNLTDYTAVVNFENNTVFNLHAGTNNGLLHMAGANSVVFRNNLVNFYSLNATEHVIRIWKNTPAYTIENNHFWARASSGIPSDLTFYGNGNVMVEAADAAVSAGTYPYASNVSGAGATR